MLRRGLSPFDADLPAPPVEARAPVGAKPPRTATGGKASLARITTS